MKVSLLLKRRIRIVLGLSLLVVASGSCRGSRGTVQHASLLAERGNYPQAIALLERATAGPDASLGPLHQLMRLYAMVGDWANVTYIFERLERLQGPNSPDPWLVLGHAYELSHDYSEALAAYDRASQVAPNNYRGPAVAGRRAARWGEWELAEAHLTEAIRRDAKQSGVFHSLGFVLFSMGRLREAKVAYRQGLAVKPVDLANHLGLASVALRLETPKEALLHYEFLVAARPGFAAAYLGRSWALLLLGRLSAASEALLEAEKHGADAQVVARQRQHLKGVLGQKALSVGLGSRD